MKTAERAPVDYRVLMSEVEQAVAAIEHAESVGDTIHTVTSLIIQRFHEPLGLYAGRLYHRQGRSYVLEKVFGDVPAKAIGTRVSRTYEPVQIVLERGVVYMDETDPRFDRRFEAKLGVDQFAAIEVADGEYLIAFNVAQGQDREDVQFSLGILRHAINQRVRHERIESIFAEARKIQASLLPRRAPVFGHFDVWGRSVAMESVGGDFYDFIPLTDKILGLAIADSSGHGLPAALQTRDIYMGLHMGLARDFKIVRTVERMNQIIHRSTLTSRFVSMFYGELERAGVFIYVNAGHPPPFHLATNGEATALEEGGAVLGPVADATYERGFVKMKPGDLLLLYTDGISETRGKVGDGWGEYGSARLLAVAAANRHETAERIVDAIFQDLGRFSGYRPATDDRTLVVVRYPEA